MSRSDGSWLTDPDTTDEELEEAAEIARQTQEDLNRCNEEEDDDES